MRAIVTILCMMLVFSLSGCGATTDGDQVALPTSATNSVVDAVGAELEIPESGDVSIASVYAVSVPFIVALDLSDQVVAINYKSKFWADNVEGLANAGSVGRGIVDLELLAEYDPDVLIHRTGDPRTLEAVSALNVPVMCIRAENYEEILSTLDMMGRYFHAEARAEEVKDWMDSKFDKIAQIVETIPQDERLSAIVLGNEVGVVAGGDMLQSWMVQQAGGISLTSDIIETGNENEGLPTAWTNIGVESVFDMDPDVIFCTSSTVLNYSVEELLESQTWSEMKAVKDRRVLQIPAKWDAWDLPGVNCTLGTMWMLHSMYPEYFSAEELQAEIDDYYTFMFGRTFDREYIGYELTPREE